MELTRLHRLTDKEAELILDYRLLSDDGREFISALTQRQAACHVEPTAGNVVSIARRPAD